MADWHFWSAHARRTHSSHGTVKSELDPTELTQVFSSSISTDARGEKIDAHRRNEPSAIHNNKVQEHIPKRLAIIYHLSEMSRVFVRLPLDMFW
jgi:hypothetical protein